MLVGDCLLFRLLLTCPTTCLCPCLAGGVMVIDVSSLHFGRSLTRMQFLRPDDIDNISHKVEINTYFSF